MEIVDPANSFHNFTLIMHWIPIHMKMKTLTYTYKANWFILCKFIQDNKVDGRVRLTSEWDILDMFGLIWLQQK